MPNYNFFQLDVFTDHAFGGNPLAVFPEAEGITDEQMHRGAAELLSGRLDVAAAVAAGGAKSTTARTTGLKPALRLVKAGA